MTIKLLAQITSEYRQEIVIPHVREFPQGTVETLNRPETQFLSQLRWEDEKSQRFVPVALDQCQNKICPCLEVSDQLSSPLINTVVRSHGNTPSRVIHTDRPSCQEHCIVLGHYLFVGKQVFQSPVKHPWMLVAQPSEVRS